MPIQRFDARMLNANEARFVTELKRLKVADLARGAERLTPLGAADIVQGYLANGAPDPLPPEEGLID